MPSFERPELSQVVRVTRRPTIVAAMPAFLLAFLLLQGCAGPSTSRAAPPASSAADDTATATKQSVSPAAVSKESAQVSSVESTSEVAERSAGSNGGLADEDKKLFLAGVDALDAGRLALATENFETLSQRYPKRASVWANLGTARMAGGEEDKARLAYERAITLDPSLAAIHERLGVLYAQRGEQNKALEAYEAALAVEPGRARVHINMGILYERDLGQPRKALEHYRTYQRASGATDPQVQEWIEQLDQ